MKRLLITAINDNRIIGSEYIEASSIKEARMMGEAKYPHSYIDVEVDE